MNRNAIPDLSSRELQAVCAIAESGSFMAASLDLNVSQPALTRTVQRVEHAMGIEIFRRTTRRLEITTAGQEFIALANRILADLRISFASMREISDEQRGQVIIAAVMSVAYTKLPGIVARYRASRPGVEIQLREGVNGTVLDDVKSGVADLGVTYVDDVPLDFQARHLGTERFHVVTPKGHPLAKKKGVSFEEVSQFAMVSLPKESHTRRYLDGIASSAGLALQHAVTVAQFATVMQCVYAGVGVAIVPGGAIPAAVSAGLISRPLTRPAVERKVGVVTLKERGLTPSARGFFMQVEDDWASQ